MNAAERNVLYLNSYNLGYKWTDEVTEGVFERFSAEKDIGVYSEFLDAKRFPAIGVGEDALGLLRSKYEGKVFDVILCSDNAAVDFVLKYRDEEIFKEVPVVFCGITNTEDYLGVDRLWGVREDHNFEEYIETIYRLKPDVEELHLVLNPTPTGQLYRKIFESIEEKWVGRLSFRYHMGHRVDEVPEYYSGLGKNGLLYYIVVTNDRDGNPVSSFEFLGALKEHCSVPIFGDLMGENSVGLVGGPANEGLLQGTMAAGLAIDLIRGRTLARKIENRRVTWYFDYAEMKKAGMDPAAIPVGSVLLNEPSGIWEKHRREIIVVGVVLVLLVVAVLLLVSMLILKRNHEEELVKEKEKAEQSDRLKSAFLQNISHEIRTPLNAMIGFSNLLRHDTTLDEAAQESVDHIMNGGYILRDTISNILEFSRIESEGIGVEPSDVLLIEVLRKLRSEDVVDTWGEERLQIIDETPAGTVLRVDAVMLVKALAHLVHNGLKFSKDRPVTLRCRLETEEVVFTVEDQGIGITDTNVKQMFLPFRKGNLGATEFYPGAGLGLTITVSYVERMRGEVTIAPRQGKGTKASLKIPVR
ncbi:sensor histidine kinase [Pelagicoccus mobilis]|nr:HAMP domain-containing sensor histidine kinase [Pelagicoccus mobilis]